MSIEKLVEMVAEALKKAGILGQEEAIKKLVADSIKSAAHGGVIGGLAGFGSGSLAGTLRGEGYISGGVEGARKGVAAGTLGAGLLRGGLEVGLNKEVKKAIKKTLGDKAKRGAEWGGGLGAGIIGASSLMSLPAVSAGGITKKANTALANIPSYNNPYYWEALKRLGASTGIGAGIGAGVGAGVGGATGLMRDEGFSEGFQRGAIEGAKTGGLVGAGTGLMQGVPTAMRMSDKYKDDTLLRQIQELGERGREVLPYGAGLTGGLQGLESPQPQMYMPKYASLKKKIMEIL